MSEASIIERLLDPAATPPPAEWLWPCMLGGGLLSLLGLAVIARLLRGFGPPTGSLPGPAGLMAFGLALGVVWASRAAQQHWEQPLLAGATGVLASVAALTLLAVVQSLGPPEDRPQWIRTDMRSMGRAAMIWVILVPTLSACVLASVAGVRLAGHEITQQPQVDAAIQGSGAMWTVGWYVLASLSAPLVEEFTFRLVLFGVLAGLLSRGQKGWRDPGRLAAAGVSIGVFVDAHGAWLVGVVPLATLAAVLTALFAHSRSLWPCVLVHALHNALVLTMQFFVLGGH